MPIQPAQRDVEPELCTRIEGLVAQGVLAPDCIGDLRRLRAAGRPSSEFWNEARVQGADADALGAAFSTAGAVTDAEGGPGLDALEPWLRGRLRASASAWCLPVECTVVIRELHDLRVELRWVPERWAAPDQFWRACRAWLHSTLQAGGHDIEAWDSAGCGQRWRADVLLRTKRAWWQRLDRWWRRPDHGPEPALARPAGQLERQYAELQRAYETIDVQRKSAETALVVKGQFVATMSHELRTPLNGILGAASILESGGDDPEVREEMLEILVNSAHDLLGLIEGILDFSQLERGELAASPEAFVVQAMVNHTLDEQRRAAAEKGLNCLVAIDASVPRKIIADHRILRAILRQLLSNAVKFTSAGEVEIGVWAAEGALLFAVRDTGIGIAPANLERIFECFTQVDASSTRDFGGAGLGLALCSELVSLCEGQLEVESVQGQGSTFSVHVPYEEFVPEVSEWGVASGDAFDPEDSKVAMLPMGRRVAPLVLVVEDDPCSARVLCCMLENLGCEVDYVDDGAKAYEIAETRSFDLVFMDCEMPVMDGKSAAEAIRSLDPPHCSMPIIATTAFNDDENLRSCVAHGMNDYLAKPVKMAELRAMLATHIPGLQFAADRSAA